MKMLAPAGHGMLPKPFDSFRQIMHVAQVFQAELIGGLMFVDVEIFLREVGTL